MNCLSHTDRVLCSFITTLIKRSVVSSVVFFYNPHATTWYIHKVSTQAFCGFLSWCCFSAVDPRQQHPPLHYWRAFSNCSHKLLSRVLMKVFSTQFLDVMMFFIEIKWLGKGSLSWSKCQHLYWALWNFGFTYKTL